MGKRTNIYRDKPEFQLNFLKDATWPYHTYIHTHPKSPPVHIVYLPRLRHPNLETPRSGANMTKNYVILLGFVCFVLNF